MEDVECTGQPAPEWMATMESINALAAPMSARVDLRAAEGRCVTYASTPANGTHTIEDRCGKTYMRSDKRYEDGEIVKIPYRSEYGQRWIVHVRILRSVKLAEVKAVSKRWAGRTPIPVTAGKWYEVMSD